MQTISFAIFTVLAVFCAAAAELNFADFGGKGDNKTDNRTAFLKAFEAMKAAPGSTLNIAPGTYRVSTGTEKFVHERYHMIVRNLKKGTINGKQAKIVFTDPEHGGFLFYLCPDLKLNGLTFDWDPLAFTQGEIVSVDPQNPKVFTYKLEEGFPEATNKNFKNYAPEGKFMIGFVYDPATRKLFTARMRDNHKSVSKVEKIGERLYRITLKNSPEGIAAGRLFVLLSRNPSNGIVFHACERLRVNDITMYSSSHIGMVFRWGTVDPELNNVQIRILPNSRRMLSVNADSLFFDGCRKPILKKCYLEGGMDDGIVLPVHGRRVVEKIDDKTFVVRCTWGVAFFNNHILEGIDLKTGKRTGAMFATSVKDRRLINKDGKRYEAETVTFHRPAPNLKVNDFLFNRSLSNQDFLVEDCEIKNLRGKAVKIHGQGGTVRNCRIDGTTFGGIEIGYQGGRAAHNWVWMWADNIAIQNNLIRNTANLGLIELTSIGWATAIRINQGPDNLTERPNCNIRITGNTIENSGQAAFRAWAAENITFTGNTIRNFNLMKFPTDTKAIDLINVKNAVTTGNNIQ
ncbi:MAG: right-handed parallel beta-helix repeat-containing protein [Lentisphaeria bacterium]|nr:right-handed parallel beta-helix repeat-containing protein [Lentisphaeria bacterium]